MSNTTTRERRQQVARLRAEGLSTNAIAAALGVAQATVRDDCRHLPNAVGTERDAIVADARERLVELHRVKRFLWPDKDDATVLSELVSVMGQIRQAEAVLDDEKEKGCVELEQNDENDSQSCAHGGRWVGDASCECEQPALGDPDFVEGGLS